MTTTCTRRIQFCAGHRLANHESKCANLHGHNYVAFFHATAPELDDIGRVIDFSALKDRIGGWIEENWDHGFIYCAGDEATVAALDAVAAAGISQKRYPLNDNPTAENLAQYLLEEVCPLVLKGTGVQVVRLTLWETENCFAEVSR